jgi:hypothetical protein
MPAQKDERTESLRELLRTNEQIVETHYAELSLVNLSFQSVGYPNRHVWVDTNLAGKIKVDLEDWEYGDYIPSLFASDFGIGYYDEDFREAKYFEKPLHSVRDLLQDFSYASTIIPRFEQIAGSYYDESINVIVLLCNFNYDGPIRAIAEGPVQLQYTGAVPL